MSLGYNREDQVEMPFVRLSEGIAMQEKLAESEDARRDVVWAIEQLGHSARAKSAGMASAVDCPLAEGKVNAEQAEVWFLQLQTEAVAILEKLK
ncbi:MAG: hypothetical protein CMF45_08850 [Legionellales bacterium]|nr:hypothetical protein [Legionellales bacterium]|tara:strand:- start:2392 stop:2673 length:282 start_codon:yes stop_codon:yes gene_type:complete